MENLLNKYKKNYWPIPIDSKHILSKEEKEKLLQYFKYSPFLSEEIAKKMEKHTKNITRRTFKLNLPQGDVHFHFVSNLSTTIINRLAEHYFFVVFLRLHYNNKYKALPFVDNVYINLLPVNVPKKLEAPMTINSINSASTNVYPEMYGGPIYIWRMDDIEKVLIHEALHSLHYDYSIINQQLLPQLQTIDSIIGKLNINEAYTELCAVFIYNLMLSKGKTDFRKIFNKDLEHSLDNCAQLMQKYEITNINNLVLENYTQDASAYSYILLKTGLEWLMLKECESRHKKRTDRLQCLEDFISLGFWGNVGENYQNILLSIIYNEKFAKKIVKHMEEKRGRPKKFLLSLE